MESPLQTRMGKMARKISDRIDQYESAVVDGYTAVGEHFTRTHEKVKDKLNSHEKKLSGHMEHCETAVVTRYSSVGEHFTHTQERLKDKLNSQERKLGQKTIHLLSKRGVPKMFAPLCDKLSGGYSDSESLENFDSLGLITDLKGSITDSREIHRSKGPKPDSKDSDIPVTKSKEELKLPEPVTDQFCSVSSTPLSETSTLSTCSYTEFSTDDEDIIKVRIPREKVFVDEFITRGAFGKVYKGTYNGLIVAVKTMTDVETFVKEIKMAASTSHPNIVRFIGVAWNSREDFCSVMEFMDGGDLRGLMDNYEEHKHSPGFDTDKIRIALHVAHALAHLHSFDVPIIHRDLKSKNILLNEALGAKLADFGVSRKRADRAMTADVGTSLWMAPEVMVGTLYDEKADMFSFGVVLSELSMHSLPYSHAKIRPGSKLCSGSKQQLSPLVILHRVATGTLSVEFSKAGPQSMVKLGRSCVSMDPTERPSAAEAMHILHTVLMQVASGKKVH